MNLHRILRIKKEKEIFYNNQRLIYLAVLIVDTLTKDTRQIAVSILPI